MAARITYLYKRGRLERMDSGKPHPTEFFYGLPQLREQGLPVDYLEDSDIGMAARPGFMHRVLCALSCLVGDVPLAMAVALLQRRYRERLPREGLLVATTTGLGLALALGRLCGLVKARVVILAMGLIPRECSAWKRWILVRLARELTVVCISRAEQSYLSALLPGQRIHYAPFGVDHRFWKKTSGSESPTEPYVLAVGNDPHRDWATLVRAWKPDMPKLQIITRLSVPAAGANVEVISGNWNAQAISDEAMRERLSGSLCVIVPLRDSIQPAGQSVSLQAMACARPVLLSDTVGLWDRERLDAKEAVLRLVPAASPEAIGEAVRALLENRDEAVRLGERARYLVESHFNVDVMAQALGELFTCWLAGEGSVDPR